MTVEDYTRMRSNNDFSWFLFYEIQNDVCMQKKRIMFSRESCLCHISSHTIAESKTKYKVDNDKYSFYSIRKNKEYNNYNLKGMLNDLQEGQL